MMGICTNNKYDYKELSESFFIKIVKSNIYNSEYWYRFKSFQLINYLAIETDNNLYGLDGDIVRIRSGCMYHLKKMGFIKSKYPSEYKMIK